MENQIIIEQPAKKKASIGAAVASLILSLIGFALGFVCYFGSITKGVLTVALPDTQAPQISGFAVLLLCAVTGLFCFIGLILGVVGLIRGIRRKTRRIAGIVLGALGIDFSIAGMVLLCISFVFSSVFALLIQSGAFN